MADATQGSVGTRAFQLEVITPERVVLDAQVRSIQVPAQDGLLGVLYGHAPLVTPLVPGTLTLVGASGERQQYAIGEGFLEVVSNRARVMVDTAERPEQVDVERARRARQRAAERLAQRGVKDVDTVRAEAALRRALARLKTAGKM